MKIYKYIAIIILLTVSGINAEAQVIGELNRFTTSEFSDRNVVKLFPNPSVDYLQVRINNSTLDRATLTVHNIIGNEIKVEVEQVETNQFRIKVEDLAPGYYLLAIKDDQNQFKETYKFLKR